MAVGAGVSLLIVGHASAALPALEALLPRPILRSLGSEPLALPDPGWSGTLLIHDIERLAANDQRRLLHWLDLSCREAQMVSAARGPILPMVEAGQFLEALYYRLNMVCIDITSGPSDHHVTWPGEKQLVDTFVSSGRPAPDRPNFPPFRNCPAIHRVWEATRPKWCAWRSWFEVR